MLVPLNITLIVSVSYPAETSNSNLLFGWDSSQTTNYWDIVTRFNRNVTSTRTFCFTGNPSNSGTETSSIENKQFVAYSSANFTSTDMAADAYITYKIMKLS